MTWNPRTLNSAGRRCLLAAAEVGGVVLVIDAKNERAAAWYSSYGDACGRESGFASYRRIQPPARIQPRAERGAGASRNRRTNTTNVGQPEPCHF
jgi:hypothetical protein